MNKEAFGPQVTGRLVPVFVGQPDWAFAPYPLPKKWDVPLSLWPLLASAREELARLDGIGRTLIDPELLLRPLQRREAIRSSSLEGTYASAEELLLFELRPQQEVAVGERANDWLEVSNYAKALRGGTELLNTLPLSLRVIREMHRMLLEGVRGRERDPGEFRRVQVHVGADRRYIPPPVNELTACLDSFEHFLNEADAIDPLIRAYMAHYQFEAIHPFLDGNGRVGRALIALTSYQWSGLSRPWLYTSPFFDTHKDEYIDALFNVSARGAWEPWLALCLRATIEVCRDATQRCRVLVDLRSDYHTKAARLPRAYEIIDGLFSNPITRITDIQRRMNVTYPTAKSDVEKLVRLGILQPLAGARPKAYFSRGIFSAAYGEN